MGRPAKARWVGVLVALVLLIVAAGAWLLWPRQKVTAVDELLVRAGRFAPPSAISVVHFNVNRYTESLDAMTDGNRTAGRERPSVLPAVLWKIDSIDAYELRPVDQMNPLVAFYGSFGAEDIALLEQSVRGTGAARIQKGLNGRYQVHLKDELLAIVSKAYQTAVVSEFVLILGGEADDVPDGMALAGLPGTLTPEFLKMLGKGSNKTLPGLLKGVDASADAWGVIGPGAIQGENAPRSVKGSLFFVTRGRSRIEAIFDSAEMGGKFAKEIERSPVIGKFLQEDGDIEVKGDRLTIAWKTTDPIFTPLFEKARTLARRAESRANLQGIGLVMATYVYDWDNDAWPPDLEALVKQTWPPDLKSLLRAKHPSELFVSPGSGRKSPYDAKGKFRSDYIYIKGIPISGPGYLITVYEPPEFNDFECVLVLDYNGSVFNLKPAEFKREVERTEKWFKEKGKTFTMDPKTREWLKSVGGGADKP